MDLILGIKSYLYLRTSLNLHIVPLIIFKSNKIKYKTMATLTVALPKFLVVIVPIALKSSILGIDALI